MASNSFILFTFVSIKTKIGRIPPKEGANVPPR